MCNGPHLVSTLRHFMLAITLKAYYYYNTYSFVCVHASCMVEPHRPYMEVVLMWLT